MRRILPGLLLLAAVCICHAPVEAREVVEFADGRYLEIRSYVVHGDLIRIDVDRGSFMVIPVASVDEIRRDREVVFTHERGGLPGARTASSTPGRRPSDRPRRDAVPRVRALAGSGS